LRIRQVKAGQVSGIINLNPTRGIRFEKQFDVIVNPDIKTQWYVGDIDVTRVAIIIAVRNAEREFTAA
jgi:hypothetical protein